MSADSAAIVALGGLSTVARDEECQQSQRPSDDRESHKPRTSEDKRLFEELYREYSGELRRYLLKILGSGPPDPDDICQEAFRRIAETRNLKEIKSLNAFLWRTAQNAIVSEQRKITVRAKHIRNVEQIFYPEKGDSFSPERVLLARSELIEIADVLMNMDSKRREVLMLSRFDGLSLAEIARRLGVARPTVSKRLAQAMLELDAAIEDSSR